MRLDIEPVAVGLGVDREVQSIHPLDRRVEPHQRPATPDIGRSRHCADLRPPGHRRPELEPPYFEFADMYVEPWQDRPGPASWLERRQPRQRHAVGLDPVDVQPIAEPRPRRPVEQDIRRGQEHALLVRHTNVLEMRIAEHRAFDPPDLDLEPRCRFDPRYPVR